MKTINCASSSLNMMILSAALQERIPGDLLILVGHAAQHAAYLALLECLSTHEADKFFSMPFQINNGLPTSSIQVWSFLPYRTEKIAEIVNLAIPFGFEGNGA